MVVKPAKFDRGARRVPRLGRSTALRGLALLGASALASAVAGAAGAQDAPAAPEVTPVLERPRTAWQPTGIPAGGFTVLPSITFTAERDDNILASQTGALADALFVVAPRLVVRSDWNQNALVLFGDAAVDRYATYASQDTYQYTLKADGTLNVRRDFTVTGEAFYSTAPLPRTSDAYYQNSVTPLMVDEAAGNIDVSKTFDKLEVTASGSIQDYSYGSGLTSAGKVISQSFRDSTSYLGTIRGVYTFSPNRSVFVEQSLTHTVYSRAAYRDQDIYETLVGPDLQVTHLLKAEVGVGYLQGSFVDALAPTIRTFTGRAQLTYFPTQLVTVTLTARQHVFDSGDPLSPAYLQRQLTLEADYELLRNVIISLKGADAWDTYRVIDRRDTYPDATLDATWFVNRGLSLNFAYDHLERTSAGRNAGLGFVDNRVSLGLTLQR